MSNLVDRMLIVQGRLERRQAGLAIFQPKIIAQTTIRPEVDKAAIAFFKKFDEKRAAILAADEWEAQNIALACCSHYDFYHFFDMLSGVSTVTAAPDIDKELVALRTARKAIRWVETSGLLTEADYDG